MWKLVLIIIGIMCLFGSSTSVSISDPSDSSKDKKSKSQSKKPAKEIKEMKKIRERAEMEAFEDSYMFLESFMDD
ncbi:MAG: hypothetical protein K6F34_06295 [Lachnospiraceae bacterium]|nr:hypothetical protein [Lachnospiraceae bacterium]